MNSSLLTSLISFYEEDPHDPFNIYALAIEYAKYGREEAEAYFNTLLTEHPDYIATYYHAAAFFAGQGRTEAAAGVYKKGIEVALAQKNSKAHRELLGAYNSFLDELDD